MIKIFVGSVNEVEKEINDFIENFNKAEVNRGNYWKKEIEIHQATTSIVFRCSILTTVVFKVKTISYNND